MNNRFKRILSVLLAAIMIVSTMSVIASAATYTFSNTTTTSILSKITSDYSKELSDKISRLLYTSDYSDLMTDKTTLRNYAENGNKKSWPISNADSFGTSVVDGGETVNWGWGSAGCMSYACFFSYSVYGTIGTKGDVITLDKSNSDAAKNYIEKNAQPGEHIRVSSPHSIIFLSLGTENGADGFYFCEYWGGATKNKDTGHYEFDSAKDQYYISFRSFDSFATKYNGNKMFVYDAFESSEFAKDTDDDTNVTTISRSIVLVLDISGSMSGTKLSNTKTAAKSFATQVLTGTTNTYIAVVSYGSYVYTNCSFTRNEATLNAAIDGLDVEGATNIHGALTRADELLAAQTTAKKAIVLMTDGMANEGAYSQSGSRATLDGSGTFRVDSYGAAIYDLCVDYKNQKGYYIYTLGFGLSEGSYSYNLLKNICSPGTTSKFVSVTSNNVNDLVIGFDFINANITKSKQIYIQIECPVDVSIARAGESISTIGVAAGNILSATFGKIKVLDNGGERSLALELDYYVDYDIVITGNGNGTMDLKVVYVNGDTSTYREFKNVGITPSTSITTSNTDLRADFALYVDNDKDGIIDSGWAASVNETVTQKVDDIIEQLYPNAETEPLGSDEDDGGNPNGRPSILLMILNFLLDVILFPINLVLIILRRPRI